MYVRLKNLRKKLNLSQKFVAKKMNIARSTLVAIENNHRKISAEELKKFSELYMVSLDEIIYGNEISNNPDKNRISMFVQKFSKLSTESQNEIMDFIDFKYYCQLKNGENYE